MAARLRKGDQVAVISGADKGKRGKILRMVPKDGRAIVEGVNLAKHHRKPAGVGQLGGIVEQEATIHVSNLMLVDETSDRVTKVGFRFEADGNKVRYAKRSNASIRG